LIKIANSSIDISDGLFADLNKLINKQKIGYIVYLDKIPISKNLNIYLKKKNKKSLNFISKGDDYQILFTSSKKNRIYIKKLAKRINLKITKIGTTTNIYKQRKIINHKKYLKSLNYQGYSHKF
jgi:thiamine-monophosphate kinase